MNIDDEFEVYMTPLPEFIEENFLSHVDLVEEEKLPTSPIHWTKEKELPAFPVEEIDSTFDEFGAYMTLLPEFTGENFQSPVDCIEKEKLPTSPIHQPKEEELLAFPVEKTDPTLLPDDISEEEQTSTYSETFTVFVIQSHLLYKATDITNTLIERISKIISENPNVLFVFSDVSPITDSIQNGIFNNSISHAFLFYDDIVRFVRDRGQRSVFGQQDEKELKELFGKCVKYDGFHMDIDTYTVRKLKFVKGV